MWRSSKAVRLRHRSEQGETTFFTPQMAGGEKDKEVIK